MKIDDIQEQLRARQLDGWLFFDHHLRDPLAYRVLGLKASHVTRRWYYFIPAQGQPRKLVHRIESAVLNSIPGDRSVYSSWSEQVEAVSRLLDGARIIAMQYSPMCSIPYVSNVDGGTLELVRNTGVTVVSSAELIQYFEARLGPEAAASHFAAGELVDRIRSEAFELIARNLRDSETITEWAVSEFVLRRFREENLTTDHGPIVGVNEHSADPHFEPGPNDSFAIENGSFVLLDMWAKLNQPDSIFYDITWTGFCGSVVPAEIARVFDVVRRARDAAIERVQEAFGRGEILRGFEVDDVCRGVIAKTGYGDRFIHRTGHSIGADIHGNGANMDNLETHDDRPVTAWSCFSIEPGIYLEKFGIRSEVNMLLDANTARVSGAIQKEVVPIY